uniref:F-box associated beta-propeller type 3 domain-containing protein n=2 Tax=Aegilops tauschii TaxID=37682 RepID=A0A453GIP0_AEGTS
IATGDNDGGGRIYRSILTFDHRAADAQLQHVTRLDNAYSHLEASCDGLILIGSVDRTGPYRSICNPATRQCARLPMLSDFFVLGMYWHHPTGEYRILYYHENEDVDGDDACYIVALGSVQTPRNIMWQPEAQVVFYHGGEAVLLRSSLHWPLEQHEIGSNNIMVFDTTTESFRVMHAPVAPVIPFYNCLFEMDGMLGMYGSDDAKTTINIWVLPDYESEVWTLKCKIELPVTEIKAMCGKYEHSRYVVFVSVNGELLVLAKFAEWLLQVDMDGKLVATFHRKEVVPTEFKLKQTLIPHPFFPTQDGNAVNAPSLI